MTDVVQLLTHDHADINQRVLAVARAMEAAAPRETVTRQLVELRELLFLHFAREEEGLFPFVAQAFPDLVAQVDGMAVAHDTICGALARACYLATSEAGADAIAAIFTRFQEAYGTHAGAEAELLRGLDARLDLPQRTQLAALVQGL